MIVSGLDGSECVDITRAWTVNNLPIFKKSIPTADDVAACSHLDGIVFPELENVNVRMIIGSDVPEAHWVLEQRRGGQKEPYAVRTPLDWTLMGPIGIETEQEFLMGLEYYGELREKGEWTLRNCIAMARRFT